METKPTAATGYSNLVVTLERVITDARRLSARTVNAVMTATYWEVGRRIVEFEQRGAKRAGYGEELLKQLAVDLSARHGRGFSERNLEQMRQFYLAWPISQTLSAKSSRAISQTMPAESALGLSALASSPSASRLFPLPWSHYVRLMTVKNALARRFYETEALRGGWSVRQLNRQVTSLFYERTALSRNKASMLLKGAKAQQDDRVSVEEEIKDPYLLEFLDLKDEYSESELEEALLRHLENFLLELGSDFAFVGRQRRLRIGGTWYRVDLLFFHRRLRCLVIIDLKTGQFTHADAGQMHVYLNYARKHWMQEGENPPVGLILCSEPGDALVQYALEGLPNRVLTREYRLALPKEKRLEAELEKTRHLLETQGKR